MILKEKLYTLFASTPKRVGYTSGLFFAFGLLALICVMPAQASFSIFIPSAITLCFISAVLSVVFYGWFFPITFERTLSINLVNYSIYFIIVFILCLIGCFVIPENNDAEANGYVSEFLLVLFFTLAVFPMPIWFIGNICGYFIQKKLYAERHENYFRNNPEEIFLQNSSSGSEAFDSLKQLDR